MRHALIVLILFSVHWGVTAQNEPTLDVIPNSFVDTTTIVFTLPATDTVSLIVYDLLGKLVDSMINEQLLPQGTQTIQFVGDTLPVGQYLVFLDVDTHLISKKFVKMGQLTLGLQEAKFENSYFTIYPNPSTGLITLTNLPQGVTSITIYNTLGKLIHEGALNGSDNLGIDLSAFPRGLYLTQLESPQMTLRKKVIRL